ILDWIHPSRPMAMAQCTGLGCGMDCSPVATVDGQDHRIRRVGIGLIRLAGLYGRSLAGYPKTSQAPIADGASSGGPTLPTNPHSGLAHRHAGGWQHCTERVIRTPTATRSSAIGYLSRLYTGCLLPPAYTQRVTGGPDFQDGYG